GRDVRSGSCGGTSWGDERELLEEARFRVEEIAPATGRTVELRVVGVAVQLGRRRITVTRPEPGTAATDPAEPASRGADDPRVGRDIAGHARSGAAGRESPDLDTGDDDRPGADRAAVAEDDRTDRPVVRAGELAGRRDRPREAVVREDRIGSDEDPVL